MSRGGVEKGAVSRDASPVYRRGKDDDSLWDDADLIRLWNAQLEQQQQKKKTDDNSRDDSHDNGDNKARPTSLALYTASSGDGSVITSASTEETEETSVSSTDEKERVVSVPALPTLAEGGLEQNDRLGDLPADVRRVVLAYYRAGYEAGYFIGKNAKRMDRNRKKRSRSD